MIGFNSVKSVENIVQIGDIEQIGDVIEFINEILNTDIIGNLINT